MQFLRKYTAVLSPALAAIFIYTTIMAAPAAAGVVSTDQLIDAQAADQGRGKVAAFLAREDVRRQMESMGVDPKQVDARLSTLSDTEVSYLAERIDELPAGQGVIGLIIVVGIVVFVVLLITDIVGVTNVFSFVNKPAQR